MTQTFDVKEFAKDPLSNTTAAYHAVLNKDVTTFLSLKVSENNAII